MSCTRLYSIYGLEAFDSAWYKELCTKPHLEN